jgi:hypothetical protein
MATLLLFVDGVGVGADDPGTNPFAAIDARRLSPVRGRAAGNGLAFRALDATLGVPGLPQSATGQTTLFTGVNAAKFLGRHQVGIPGPTLHPVLERESLFRKLVEVGRRPTFANGYTRAHLEARRPRWSASTRMVRASGVALRMLDEPAGGERALIHDYTGEWAAKRGIAVPRRTADEAAAVLAAMLVDHDVVLYEYFLTDLAGHRGSPGERVEQARRVEDLTDAVLRRVDLDRHAVLWVSDHGNLEESGHDRHTPNPVPLLGWGRGAQEIVGGVAGMTDLTPAIVESGGGGQQP